MSNKEALGFEAFVSKAFDYLVRDHGFVKTVCNSREVQFNSSDRYVKVLHGRNEIDLVIGLLGANIEVTINDVIAHSSDAGAIGTLWNWNASNQASVELGVSHLADFFYRIGEEAVIGDGQYIKDVYSRSAELRKEAMQLQKLREIEETARQAWTNHDFDLVISIYEPIEEHLDAVQKKRLHLAKRKVSERFS